MKKTKLLISFILALSFSIVLFALRTEYAYAEIPDIVEQNETKIYNNASSVVNYADDAVIVVLKDKNTANLKTYSTNEFSEISSVAGDFTTLFVMVAFI